MGGKEKKINLLQIKRAFVPQLREVSWKRLFGSKKPKKIQKNFPPNFFLAANQTGVGTPTARGWARLFWVKKNKKSFPPKKFPAKLDVIFLVRGVTETPYV